MHSHFCPMGTPFDPQGTMGILFCKGSLLLEGEGVAGGDG